MKTIKAHTKSAKYRAAQKFLFCLALLNAPAATSVVADEQPLRLALWALPQEGAHPLYTSTFPGTMIMPAIYDVLTEVDQAGVVGPSLAVGWTQLDPLTWEFELRPGVVFSNGEPFDADAVVNAFSYLTSDEGLTGSVARSVDAISRVEASGDLAVNVITKYPAARLPYEISAVRFPAPNHWRSLGATAFSRDPVGTGPYTVSQWGEGAVRLDAFEDSWRAPKIAAIDVKIVSEETARLQALQSDTIDIAVGLSQEAQTILDAIKGRLVLEPSTSILGLAFVTTQGDSPIQDKRVRQAMNLAVNREAIVASLYGGATVPASQVVIPQAFGFDASLTPYPYDPDRAKSLLADAGYENGFDFPVEVNMTMGGNAAAVFQQVSIDLSRIGVRMTLLPMTTVTLVQRIMAGGWKGDAFTMDYDSTRSLDGLRPFKLHSCVRAIPWYCNPEDTALILSVEVEPDLVKREEMIRQLVRRYHDDPPGIVLFQMIGAVGLGPRVGNYGADFGVIRYDEITFSSQADVN